MRSWHWNIACPKMACSSARGSWGQSWWLFACFYQGWSTFNVESTCQRRCQGSLLCFFPVAFITTDSDHLEKTMIRATLSDWSRLLRICRQWLKLLTRSDKRATLHHLKSDCLLSCPTKNYNNMFSGDLREFFLGVSLTSAVRHLKDGGTVDLSILCQISHILRGHLPLHRYLHFMHLIFFLILEDMVLRDVARTFAHFKSTVFSRDVGLLWVVDPIGNPGNLASV